METLSGILRLLYAGLWVTSIDLKDAYLHIPVRRNDQDYTSVFLTEVTCIDFVAMPFGLSTAPRIFTRVEGPSGFSAPKGNKGFQVSGRLANRHGVQRTLPVRHSFGDSRNPVTRMGHKPTEIQSQCPLNSQFFWVHGWIGTLAWLIPRRRDGTPSRRGFCCC